MTLPVLPSTETAAEAKAEGGSVVERVYERLKLMAISFEFRPNERINEVALARFFGISRTPLREALNRLVADEFLNFSSNRGFTGRALDVKEIFDLYEVRQQIEIGAISLSIQRAADDALDVISRYLDESAAEVPGRTIDDLVALDEGFHERLIALSGNGEMLRILKNVNARIRFVRWVDMEARRVFTQREHREILDAVRARDEATAITLLSKHITRRLDQVVHAVKEAYARIYVRPSLALMEKSGN